MKFSPIAFIALVLSPCLVQLPAQDTRPATAKKTTTSLLDKLMAAAEAERSAALAAFIGDQVSSGAVYAGQYSSLRKLEWDVVAMLSQWVVKAPAGTANADAFRIACINALRDVIEGEADETLRKTLVERAKDILEPPRFRSAAGYALAQFGDRSFVEKAIEAATKMTESADAMSQARGYQQLSDTYYNIRQYEDAAKAYQKLLGLIESGKISMRNGSATIYYNCACSLALSGKTEAALELVEKALKDGKKSGQQLGKRLLETDQDISSLRGHPKFAELMKEYFGGDADKGEKKK